MLCYLLALGDIESLYCFVCKSIPENIPKKVGWNFFDLQAEYQRMQVPNEEWCLTKLNKDYEVRRIICYCWQFHFIECY